MKEQETKSGEVLGVDLWKLLLACLRRWPVILISGVVCAVCFYVYTVCCITPMYRASVMVYVNNIKSNQQVDYISASNLATAQQLVNTYVNIIRSDTVLEKVVESAGLEYTADQIRSMMTASQVEETELFEVYILTPDPELSARIANAVAEVAPNEIANFVEGSSTKIIDYAKVPEQRYSPSYRNNTFLGGILGCLLAALYIAVRTLTDVRLTSGDDLAQLFDYPLLGQIPMFERTGRTRGGGYAVYDDGAPPQAGAGKEDGQA